MPILNHRGLGEWSLMTSMAGVSGMSAKMELDDLTIVLHEGAVNSWNRFWYYYQKRLLSSEWVHAFTMLRKVVLRVEGGERLLEPKLRAWVEGLRDKHLVRVERRGTTMSARKGVSWSVFHRRKFVDL